MIRIVLFLTLNFLLLLPQRGLPQKKHPLGDTLELLDALTRHWNTSTPGGVLAIARGERILYEKAAGMADLEHHIAVQSATLFEAGSVSKQFTATAVLLLARDGKLSLDDDIRKYIPELPDYGAPVRIRHLLTHTSGLKDWGSIASLTGWPRTTRSYTQDHAREIIFRQKSLNFPPGTAYSYSNSNYTLLTTLVERLSGESLAAFSRRRILQPAGMEHTLWRDDFRQIVPGRAVAYDRRDDQFVQVMPFENTYGHAALLTTGSDLVKWARYWVRGGFGNELLAWREERGVLADGDTISYCLGAVVVQTFNGHREVSHSGATAGYRAWLAYYPDQDLTVAYLSNDGSTAPTTAIGARVAEIFFGKPPARLTSNPTGEIRHALPKDFARLVGTYYSEEAETSWEIRAEGENLSLFRRPSTHIRLHPAGTDSLSTRSGLILHVIRNKKGRPSGLEVSVERAQRVIFHKMDRAAAR